MRDVKNLKHFLHIIEYPVRGAHCNCTVLLLYRQVYCDYNEWIAGWAAIGLIVMCIIKCMACNTRGRNVWNA